MISSQDIYIFGEGVTDFERLQPIRFTDTANIRLFTSNDDVCLEYDDRVQLRFTPDNLHLTPALEALGPEYIRATATINIIDNDCKIIFLSIRIIF